MRQLPCKRGSRSVITYIYISLVRKLTVRYCSQTNSNSVSPAPFFAPRLSIRIVRPFSFHRGQTGLHFASIQLANNSVSTWCQKSKKEAGKRERKERDIERKKKRTDRGEIDTEERQSEQWLAVYNGRRAMSFRDTKKWVRERAWELWTSDEKLAMNGRLRNERTNENACVCACVQAGEETNITRRGGRRKPSEETRKICKRLNSRVYHCY